MASEYLKWKYRDVRPEEHKALTRREAWRNWWDYHKWPLLIGIALALVIANLVWGAATQVRPDYQLSYIGQSPLPEEEAVRWQERLELLGADCNGDGRVVVQLNQYIFSEGQDATYAYASEVKLMADLSACDSYFFLLEDPEGFNAEYGALEEGWLEADGLWLARRSFAPGHGAQHMEECGLLWERLQKEGI